MGNKAGVTFSEIFNNPDKFADEDVNDWYKNNLKRNYSAFTENTKSNNTTTTTQIYPKKNSVTATSTTEVKETPKGTTITKTVVEPQVKPFESKAYESTVTPFGEKRQPTGLESLFGYDPVAAVELHRRNALGIDKGGTYTPPKELDAKDPTKAFLDAHKGFDLGNYLSSIARERDKGDYSLAEEGILDKLNKFFTVPLDEAKRTEDAYAGQAFDRKIRNLVDDIALYNAYHDQLSQANAKNEMPKIRADDKRLVTDFNLIPIFNSNSNYDPATQSDIGYDSAKFRTTLKDDIAKKRPAIEKDIYQKLSKLNKYGSL